MQRVNTTNCVADSMIGPSSPSQDIGFLLSCKCKHVNMILYVIMRAANYENGY